MASSNTATGARFTETSTDRKFAPGMISESDDGTVWQYVQASAAFAIGDSVSISSTGAAVLVTSAILATTTWNAVGCAQVAFASGEYGWVVRQGAFTARFNGAAVLGVKLYAAGTGALDDAVAGAPIQGLVATSTVTGAGLFPVYATTLMYA